MATFSTCMHGVTASVLAGTSGPRGPALASNRCLAPGR
jgi:hypothetical protein